AAARQRAIVRRQLRKFPDAPDAFAFVVALVEDVVFADVFFGPGAFAVAGIVAALDGEFADPVAAFTGHLAVLKGEAQFHEMAAGNAFLQEIAGPRAGRKARIGFERRHLIGFHGIILGTIFISLS